MSDLNYDEASRHLSPGMREFLLKVASRSGIAEDDSLYAVIAAHGDMLDEKLKAVHEKLAEALKGSQNGQLNHAEDLEAVRAEITQLAMMIRAMGESCVKLERRFTLVGDTLTKFEERNARIEKQLSSIEETATMFDKIKTGQVWTLAGISATFGGVLVFVAHLIRLF